MKHVHWLGTGLSSIPGIRRLGERLDNFTVWNRTLEKAQASLNHVNKTNVKAKTYNLKNIISEVKPGDIIISQLPASMHPDIAKICLEKKCHFASTSYLSPEIKKLDIYAKEKNLIFINEVGLDPGIDHFFSHLLVNELKEQYLNDSKNEINAEVIIDAITDVIHDTEGNDGMDFTEEYDEHYDSFENIDFGALEVN